MSYLIKNFGPYRDNRLKFGPHLKQVWNPALNRWPRLKTSSWYIWCQNLALNIGECVSLVNQRITLMSHLSL